MHEPRGWHSRGYLPHYDNGSALQLLTYRLADALPREVVAKLEEQALGDEPRRTEIESRLDAGHGCCILREPASAQSVVDAWWHDDGAHYSLHAWVVMPNHVHVLIEPFGNQPLGMIVAAWKSVAARKLLAGGAVALVRKNADANEGDRAPKKRHVWQADYWDRFIRSERHYRTAVNYIHENPVKAGLVAHAVDWPWSSARPWANRRLCTE